MSIQHSSFITPRSAEWRWVALASIGVLALASLPYLVTALATPAGLHFGGVLINPIDGQSYLAKMRQGYDGAWLFRLPFTAQSEPNALLFTYHLGLGHLARATGLSLMAVYHLARIFGGWTLLLVVYALIARAFDATSDRRWAWSFVALTSGLGWLGLPATDLTIPESNTFFGTLTNAHFALSMALMLIVFLAVLSASWRRAAPAAIGLTILQPFSPIAVFAALGAFAAARRLRWKAFSSKQLLTLLGVGLCLAPLIGYFYMATQRDPILQGWSAQNLTPSPPLIEWLVGYAPAWLLAIPGARLAWKRGRDIDLLLMAWAATSALLLYAPFPLQRRFSLGLHIPIVLLAVLGLQAFARRVAWRRIAFLVSLPSTLLLLFATSTAAMRPADGRLFFSADEAAAFDWLRDNVPHEARVLASPEIGLFLPAWADVRVIYGHPFETLDAERMKSLVEDFFAGRRDRDQLAGELQVDYIFFGPRESRLGAPAADWQPLFTSGAVTIYRPAEIHH